jgi:hypothetical protein
VRNTKSEVQVSCEYPFEVKQSSAHQIRLYFYGDPRLKGRVRVQFPASDGQPSEWRDDWVAAGGEAKISLRRVLPLAAA